MDLEETSTSKQVLSVVYSTSAVEYVMYAFATYHIVLMLSFFFWNHINVDLEEGESSAYVEAQKKIINKELGRPN